MNLYKTNLTSDELNHCILNRLTDLFQVTSVLYDALRKKKIISDLFHDNLESNWTTIVYLHNKTVKLNIYHSTAIRIKISNNKPLVVVVGFNESHAKKFGSNICNLSF